IKRQMLKLGGWQITGALYGKNIPTYIAKNDVAKEYINNTPALATQRFDGANLIPQGFQDLNWTPMGDAFYIDADGNPQQILGDDEIVFYPDIDSTWWRLFNGSEMVPAGTLQIGQS